MAVDYARRIDDYAAADEAERFTRLAAPSDWSGPRILDAGCGPGRDAALLRLAGAEVVGLDLARAMLQEARRLDDSAQLSQGDLRRLPFAASSFDAIWCFAALGHLPPGAIAQALAEFNASSMAAGSTSSSAKARRPRRLLAGRAAPLLHRLTADSLTAALHAAGFTIHEQNTWPAPNQRPWLHTIARGI